MWIRVAATVLLQLAGVGGDRTVVFDVERFLEVLLISVEACTCGVVATAAADVAWTDRAETPAEHAQRRSALPRLRMRRDSFRFRCCGAGGRVRDVDMRRPRSTLGDQCHRLDGAALLGGVETGCSSRFLRP